MTKKDEKRKSLFTREVMREFIKQNNIVSAEDAQHAVQNLFADTLQELLEAKLDHCLGYSKRMKAFPKERCES
ncbi:MAG: hypothetical protein CVU87_01125 [Firmicutes bacterium HGW-Firmicutes-12]|nr:MAG: hypothetical protein CVU87_01125 [Firmicutes bacterium HGW-Firmicutes-12]